MKKGFLVAGLMLVLLGFSVQAFSLETNQTVYSKGETLVASGNCSETVSIQGLQQEKKVLAATAECQNGSYSLEQPVSFLVPSGELTITATEGTVFKIGAIEIKPTRESAFLAVSVESPARNEISRAEKVTVRVLVSDAGKPAENATLQSWTLDGKPFFLSSTAPGVYSADVAIPFDAVLQDWNLVIVAEASGSNGLYGGEESFSIPIVSAPIVLQIDSPVQQNLSVLQENLFRVKATYSDGSLLHQPVVLLQRGSQNIVLEPTEPGFFETKQSFSAEETGLQKLVLTVTDSAQNHASQNLEFFVTNDFQSQFVSFLPYLLSIVVLVALVALVLIPSIRKQKGEKGLVKRKKEIEQEILLLQKQYFEENALNKDSFRQKSVSLEQELEEIDKKLNTAKK